jgi:hypothetical protein
MTTITLRYTKGAFLVTGKDIEARKFASRREAKDWCVRLYPRSPIYEIGADSSQRKSRAMLRKVPFPRKALTHIQDQEPCRVGAGRQAGRGRKARARAVELFVVGQAALHLQATVAETVALPWLRLDNTSCPQSPPFGWPSSFRLRTVFEGSLALLIKIAVADAPWAASQCFAPYGR